MSFQVVIRQMVGRLEDSGRLTNPVVQTIQTELSGDGLQLKLIKDIQNVLSINGQKVTLAQKVAIRTLGEHYEVTDVQAGERTSVLVTARRGGYMRTWTVEQDGVGRFVDGHESIVAVSRQDPLNSAPWGDGLTEGVQ